MFHRFVSLAILVLIGFLASLTLSFASLSPTIAYTPIVAPIAQNTIDPAQLEQQGQEFFQQGKIEEAIEIWQQAALTYRNQKKWLNLASILSQLALTYQQVGLSTQAQQAITESLSVLPPPSSSKENLRVYGQILNNRGLLEFAKGEDQTAFDYWEQAETAYKTLQDPTGILRAQLNQSLALQSLGLYPRACDLLIQALALSPFSCQNRKIETTQQEIQNQEILQQKLAALSPKLDEMQVIGWRRLANILRVNGRIKEAQSILESILSRLTSPEDQAGILLSLGKLEQTQKNLDKALNFYQQSTEKALSVRTKIQSQLALLGVLVLTEQWKTAAALVPSIETTFHLLPTNHTDLYAQINFLNNLIILKEAEINSNLSLNLPSWSAIAELVGQVIQKARNLGDKRTESYGLGTLGKIYQHTQQWSTAQNLTEQALIIAQSINAPEITYRWQWQLGRLYRAQNQQQAAINTYENAVKTLELIKNDLVANSQEIQYSFQEEVEPVYRELVDLLLQPNQQGIIPQENLSRARDVIELLRIAELDNFFQQSCIVSNPKKIDDIDPQAAVVYTIILPTRLAIILSLPKQPLRYYASWVKAQELERVIALFRYNLVIRSQREFFTVGQQLYQWIIQPIEADLEASGVKTLVFVSGSALQNIPISALYDGANQQYLIQKNYNIAITSGLQLLNPLPLKETKLFTLAGGLTQAKIGFPPLRFVAQELEQIKTYVPSRILLNQEFTVKDLNQNLENNNFSILHLATHGQFSSRFEDTFILTWNERLNILQLESLLQQKTHIGQAAIELLVLSACETASGDKRAALGLAGMAVRSGARSTLATLWSVNDEATAEFMQQFYQKLSSKTLNKAGAFKQAQLNLLENPRYQHPFYWAPYVLLGNWL
ncbi:CHAT domain-containing protein [Gloeothece verrucosa]|uniref:TPR repeat-containing protein n=1 Tax=Gloeothece verrucosa (strain PCC 7822) TaxID=497965 RepID=E0U9V7_GLOV7|nr:CHAT domain-containing protein [Gloeothece verrucosa]ADN15027.1 TPR repeat-containing protein [Gloeothece verrucosa PCC 7822]